MATTIFAGRDGQSSRPPANSCAGHHLCRYTVRANSIDTPSGSPKDHYVNRAEHQPQAEHVGRQDPLRRRLTLFTPHSTQIGAAGSAWRCCWTAAAACEPSAATAAWPAGRFAEARRLWRQHRDHAPRHEHARTSSDRNGNDHQVQLLRRGTGGWRNPCTGEQRQWQRLPQVDGAQRQGRRRRRRRVRKMITEG